MERVAPVLDVGVIPAEPGAVCNTDGDCGKPAIFRLFATGRPYFGYVALVRLWLCHEHAERFQAGSAYMDN